MAPTRKKLLLLLLAAGCITQSLARRPILIGGSRPWRKNNSNGSRTPPGSSSEEQQDEQQQQQQQPSPQPARPRPYQPDFSSHFLDEDWWSDKKTRLWSADFKSRRGKQSWTSKLTILTIGMYALQVFRPDVTQMGIKISDRILRGEELYRLVTPVFLHGGLGHLFTNMYSLNQVGGDFEKLVGPGRYLATYVVAGIGGNILSAVQSRNPSLGASGAVFGIFGAYYVFLNRNEWLLGQQGQEMSGRVTQVIGMNLLLGMVNPVIDNWGHLGGAVGGAAMAYYFGPRLFLADLPSGGRVVVDKPICRLPRVYEAIPERIGNQWRRMTRRMQVERYKAELTPKPWRQNTRPHRPNPRSAPNRSIKPRSF